MTVYRLALGAMAPKLSEQINGLPKKFDRMADSISYLIFQDLLTDAEAHKARKRMVKEIEKWDREQGKKKTKML